MRKRRAQLNNSKTLWGHIPQLTLNSRTLGAKFGECQGFISQCDDVRWFCKLNQKSFLSSAGLWSHPAPGFLEFSSAIAIKRHLSSLCRRRRRYFLYTVMFRVIFSTVILLVIWICSPVIYSYGSRGNLNIVLVLCTVLFYMNYLKRCFKVLQIVLQRCFFWLSWLWFLVQRN